MELPAGDEDFKSELWIGHNHPKYFVKFEICKKCSGVGEAQDFNTH